ncbi:hypothetical protein EZV62_018608 [Acer yangbiense]|uniref:Uncharacterized protein n=1 Tax=Acer yangbiense TaxID=1000413 RepID=A0A5C7HKL7_9ROSI|nr:hypothetical protein EZV62_018608 [Acer yangbiense]
MDFPNGNNDQEDVSRLSLHPPIRKRKGRRQNISNVDGHEDDASQLKPSKKSTIVQTDSTNADDQENAEQSQLHSPSKKHKGRGRTMLKKVTKARSSGQKIVVQFNKKGVPYKKNRITLMSYVGVLARAMVPIDIQSWHKVTKDLKNKIWECIVEVFEIEECQKKKILSSAATKWRAFKTFLTKKYIIPHIGCPERFKDPPEDYNFIELSDWQQFVKYRVSEEFLKLRNDQKDRQSHNKYPHRLSRSGYVGLEEELKEDYGTTEDFDRHVLWMAARENANGDYEGEKLLSFVDKIEEIRKEVHAGKISIDGNKDILTMAFGKPEHCGRLAVGSKSNVVALGTIMPTDGPDAMVHGIPLNGNVRVTIDVAIKGSALLPIPGSSKKVSMNKKSKKLVAQPEVGSLLKQSVPQPNQVNSSHNQFQDYISNLYTYAVKTMLPNVPIEIPFEENVFGHNYTACLFQDDLMQFCSMKMISIQCITFYMRYLYEMMKDQKLVDMYVLVDPNAIASCISNADDRARNLATRLENATPEQIFLAPYHHEYCLDCCLLLCQWCPVLGLVRVLLAWLLVFWCPRQLPGSLECGYYIMKYMRDVIFDTYKSIPMKMAERKKYDQADIDFVRNEWVRSVDELL